MTTYEKLSLKLLSMIATGIGMQLSSMNVTLPKGIAENHTECASEWQKELLATIEHVALATKIDQPVS
jgi:hypothetical protein